MSTSKWTLLALVVSIALNLLLAGYLVGRINKGTAPQAHDPTFTFPQFARHLSKTRRDEMRPMIRQHMRHLRPDVRQMRGHRQALNTAITAQPFDPEALAQALSAMHTAQQKLLIGTQESFVQFVTALSKEERQQFARGNFRPRHRRPMPAEVPTKSPLEVPKR